MPQSVENLKAYSVSGCFESNGLDLCHSLVFPGVGDRVELATGTDQSTSTKHLSVQLVTR